MSVSIFWLIGGALLVALEAFGVPGIGFLFAGIGAIIAGLFVEFNIIGAEAYTQQLAVFLLATLLFAALLWKRLKNWRINPSGPRYQNMLGDEAVVSGSPLLTSTIGTVHWSGTLMQAKLQSGTTGELPVGARVTITAVDGNILTVTPK